MIIKYLFLFTKLWLWNLWHLLWTWNRVCVPKKLTKEMGLGEGCGNCIFFKPVTCLGRAGFCRKYFTLICRVDAAAWFYANLFSLPSRSQPRMSLGACSRTPAPAGSASSAQRDPGCLHTPGGSAPAPRKRGQVKHCQGALPAGWGLLRSGIILISQIRGNCSVCLVSWFLSFPVFRKELLSYFK